MNQQNEQQAGGWQEDWARKNQAQQVQQQNEQLRQQRDEQRQKQREANAYAQNLGDANQAPVDREKLDDMVKAGYENIDQPGKDPRNRPSGEVEGERNPHKSIRDLEDITGNPGHRGVTPYAPANSINPAPQADMLSINEPPGSQVLPPPEVGEGENQRQERLLQDQRQDQQEPQPQDYAQDAQNPD